MIQNIKIGLTKDQHGWRRILSQEGVPWEIAKIDENLKQYSTLILNSTLDSKKIKLINKYLKEGGAILTSAKGLKLLNKKQKITPKFINKIKGNKFLFKNTGAIDIQSQGYLIQNANVGKIYLEKNKGILIAFPFDVNDLILDKRSKKKFFPSPYRPLKEIVSLVSKGDLTRLVINSLQYLHIKRKIPYVHTWYYPKDYDNAFSFRVDVDTFLEKEMEPLLKFLKKEKLSLTWFVNVEAGKNHKKGIEKLKNAGQDIQSHAYKHIIYNTLEENIKNIKKSNNFLKKIVKNPIGFCAPFGHWNENLGKALEKLNYAYSSDYSLDYDNLPFYPIVSDKETNVLQMPVYPTCIALMIMRIYNKSMMKNYLSYLIEMQHKRQVPLFLYDHTNQGIAEYPEIFEHTIKEIKKYDNIWITTLTGFSQWWKKRNVYYEAKLVNNKIKINTKNEDKNIFIRVINPKYKETRKILKNQKISLNEGKKISSFKIKNISPLSILFSQFMFKIHYSKILFKAIKKRIKERL